MKEKTLIIAEAGVNHNGSLEMARQMVDAAADCGADYIKFQTFRTENLVNRTARQADYQATNTGQKESQYEMLKRLELSFDDFRGLNRYCSEREVGFLSTPFDMPSIEFLAGVGMDYMKVPSGEITNLPYLRSIARTGLPVIMSTGMCSLSEVGEAMSVFAKEGVTTDRIILLHCTTEYPTPMADVNLRAMETLRREFGTRVGYSDHTRGIEVAIAAVAMGASVIEKHFTLDRSLPGPDHVASLNPVELRQMVECIRNVEQAMGSGEKKITESERRNVEVARKSIVASRDIEAGEILNEENLTVKRPGTGVSPMKWDAAVGSRAVRSFKADELIEL